MNAGTEKLGWLSSTDGYQTLTIFYSFTCHQPRKAHAYRSTFYNDVTGFINVAFVTLPRLTTRYWDKL